MGMDEIWTRLSPDTRDWLIANNGDAIPADIAAEIDEAVEAANADDVWAAPSATLGDSAEEPAHADDEDEDEFGDDDPGVRYLSEEAVDWIEEFANDE